MEARKTLLLFNKLLTERSRNFFGGIHLKDRVYVRQIEHLKMSFGNFKKIARDGKLKSFPSKGKLELLCVSI